MSIIARLSRIVPLLVILAVVAGIVYLVVAWRSSPNHAKEVLIKLFTVITGALAGFFALVSLYAWAERNMAVLDLAASFCIAALICLGITRLCRATFVRHHPDWGRKPMKARRLWRRKK